MAKDLDIRTVEEMALALSGDCGFRSSLTNLQICVCYDYFGGDRNLNTRDHK